MRTYRKRYNRFVKQLSELYNLSYYEVERIYYNQNMCVSDTRQILNLKSL